MTSDAEKIRQDAERARARVKASAGKLPRPVKLPPADPHVRAKTRAHIVCVCFGTFGALLVTMYAHSPVPDHFVVLISGTPNILMEVLDRIRNR